MKFIINQFNKICTTDESQQMINDYIQYVSKNTGISKADYNMLITYPETYNNIKQIFRIVHKVLLDHNVITTSYATLDRQDMRTQKVFDEELLFIVDTPNLAVRCGRNLLLDYTKQNTNKILIFVCSQTKYNMWKHLLNDIMQYYKWNLNIGETGE